MKALIAALLAMTVSVMAEDALVEGGLSPDGRYEVRIAQVPERDPSDYAIHIHATNAKKPFYTLEGIGGYDRYGGARQSCRAFWHPTGEFVVVTDRGTKHSREIYLLAVTPNDTQRLHVPDYVQNALGRVDATHTDLHCFSTPKNWKDDDLTLELYFSTCAPERGRRFYTFSVVLHLNHGRNQAPYVQLTRVSKPKENEG